jgi:hypothetical protein
VISEIRFQTTFERDKLLDFRWVSGFEIPDLALRKISYKARMRYDYSVCKLFRQAIDKPLQRLDEERSMSDAFEHVSEVSWIPALLLGHPVKLGSGDILENYTLETLGPTTAVLNSTSGTRKTYFRLHSDNSIIQRIHDIHDHSSDRLSRLQNLQESVSDESPEAWVKKLKFDDLNVSPVEIQRIDYRKVEISF